MHSIIVFSERCTLKSVADISVIKRNEVESAVSAVYRRISEDLLSEANIMDLYNKLYPYTQNSEEIKKQHIVNIQNNLVEKSNLIVEETDASIQNGIDETTIVDEKLSELSIDVSAKSDESQKEMEEEQIVKVDNDVLAESDVKEVNECRCPRCGGMLVLRTARRGANTGNQFWGCSAYPKCKYIKVMEDTNK